MDMFTSYGHINIKKKNTDYFMILAWACPFKGHLHGELLWNSIALTCNVFTELSDTIKYGGGGYYITLFSPSIRSQGFPMTSLRFTEFCETQWRHSVKTRLYKNPPPYFIVLASSVKTKEVEVIEFHKIRKSTILFYTLCRKRDELRTNHGESR